MNVPQPPPRPPFNDALYKALSPLKAQLDDQQKLNQIRMKYDAKPKPKLRLNDVEVGPQGQIYQ